MQVAVKSVERHHRLETTVMCAREVLDPRHVRIGREHVGHRVHVEAIPGQLSAARSRSPSLIAQVNDDELTEEVSDNVSSPEVERLVATAVPETPVSARSIM